eukprot:494510_1
MTESDDLQSWLIAHNLSELSSKLLDNEVSELSDLSEFLEDQSTIDEFIQELDIPITLKNTFKNALLILSNTNEAHDTISFQSAEINKMDKALCDYYKSLGRNDYYNFQKQSKLQDFIKVNDFDEKNIDEQLGDNAQVTNCLFVD